MFRRLPTARLALAALLAVLAWTVPVTAKPLDLPLVDDDVLASPALPVLGEVHPKAPANPFPPAVEPLMTPPAETPWLFRMRPSARRTMASCLLFGAHPLLALAPTGEYLDFDEDDAPSVPSETPEPIHALPQEAAPDASTQSVCPWMRQQLCPPDRHVVLFADPDLSRDVLQNLEKLHQAQMLLLTARDLAHSGRVCEALDYLDLAHGLCPGSRIDDAIQEAAADLCDPFYCGSPKAEGAAEEQSEPATEKTTRKDAPEADQTGREIELKLSQPASLHFDHEPLYQAINDLQSWQNINIYVDKPALDAEEISLDRPVSLKVENVSLKSALEQILKQARLTYFIKDGVLQITTERVARDRIQPPANAANARPQSPDPVAIQPSLPPVDPETPAALEQLYDPLDDSGVIRAGASEAPEPPPEAPQSCLDVWRQLAEAVSHPAGGFEMEVTDKGFLLFTRIRCCGVVWHVGYDASGFSMWAAPDGGVRAPANFDRIEGGLE